MFLMASEARSWSNTSLCRDAVFTPGREGGYVGYQLQGQWHHVGTFTCLTCLKRCPGTTPHRAWKTSLDRPGEQPSLPHFLEFYENKIIQYAAFFFFLAFSRILKCSHVVCINSLFLFIDERFTLYEYIAICWWSLELFLVCSSFLSLHNKLLQSKLHITTPIY